MFIFYVSPPILNTLSKYLKCILSLVSYPLICRINSRLLKVKQQHSYPQAGYHADRRMFAILFTVKAY